MCILESGPERLTRRNFVASAAAAAVAGSASLADIANATAAQSGDKPAGSVEAMNTYGSDLLNMLVLRTYPIAIKMLKDESETQKGPQNALFSLPGFWHRTTARNNSGHVSRGPLVFRTDHRLRAPRKLHPRISSSRRSRERRRDAGAKTQFLIS